MLRIVHRYARRLMRWLSTESDEEKARTLALHRTFWDPGNRYTPNEMRRRSDLPDLPSNSS